MAEEKKAEKVAGKDDEAGKKNWSGSVCDDCAKKVAKLVGFLRNIEGVEDVCAYKCSVLGVEGPSLEKLEEVTKMKWRTIPQGSSKMEIGTRCDDCVKKFQQLKQIIEKLDGVKDVKGDGAVTTLMAAKVDSTKLFEKVLEEEMKKLNLTVMPNAKPPPAVTKSAKQFCECKKGKDGVGGGGNIGVQLHSGYQMAVVSEKGRIKVTWSNVKIKLTRSIPRFLCLMQISWPKKSRQAVPAKKNGKVGDSSQ